MPRLRWLGVVLKRELRICIALSAFSELLGSTRILVHRWSVLALACLLLKAALLTQHHHICGGSLLAVANHSPRYVRLVAQSITGSPSMMSCAIEDFRTAFRYAHTGCPCGPQQGQATEPAATAAHCTDMQ